MVTLWPNPTKGMVNVEVGETTSVEVVDLMGHVVSNHKLKKGQNVLDLGGFPDGMYILKTDQGGVGKVLLRK